MIFNLFKKIGDPPYPYDLLVKLDEKEYPKYLKKIFKQITKENLNLKNPKTFNEKIQWLKLYDSSPLKTRLTDKVLVRSWVKEKIGEEYLKPVLWTGKSFDEIPFDNLPDSFIIKANHGCKWHFVIKNKNGFLENKTLVEIVRNRFNGWMTQSFFLFAGFEKQYKDIKPQILIEPLLRDNINEKSYEIEVYCFNSRPKIIQKIKYAKPRTVSVYDENFNELDIKFKPDYQIVFQPCDDNLKLAVRLSDKLCRGFKLVRTDWIQYKGRLYFNEMTFTPFSGFYNFEDKLLNMKLGSMLDLKSAL